LQKEMILKRVLKQSIIVLLPLALLSFFVNWRADALRFLRPFGNPDLIPVSIVIGGILGIANLKGLIWGIESLLNVPKAKTKLIYLSIFRLLMLFAFIIILVFIRLVNIFGLVLGMTVVFFIFIKEGVRMAWRQSQDEDGLLK